MSKIVVNNIQKYYDKHVILDKFSYVFEEGKLYGIVGESGTGKSTLLNILGGLEKPNEGSVIYNDSMDITHAKNLQNLLKNEIAFIFQNYALIDIESVKQNLSVPLKQQKERNINVKIADALQKVGLSGFENKRVSTLSGGEQQRVALARVLLKKCEVVLADEPTGNLDENNKTVVFNILRALKDDGKTVILVTHDMALAKQCDEIINLNTIGTH